jgi:hypothetical protein
MKRIDEYTQSTEVSPSKKARVGVNSYKLLEEIVLSMQYNADRRHYIGGAIYQLGLSLVEFNDLDFALKKHLIDMNSSIIPLVKAGLRINDYIKMGLEMQVEIANNSYFFIELLKTDLTLEKFMGMEPESRKDWYTKIEHIKALRVVDVRIKEPSDLNYNLPESISVHYKSIDNLKKAGLPLKEILNMEPELQAKWYTYSPFILSLVNAGLTLDDICTGQREFRENCLGGKPKKLINFSKVIEMPCSYLLKESSSHFWTECNFIESISRAKKNVPLEKIQSIIKSHMNPGNSKSIRMSPSHHILLDMEKACRRYKEIQRDVSLLKNLTLDRNKNLFFSKIPPEITPKFVLLEEDDSYAYVFAYNSLK